MYAEGTGSLSGSITWNSKDNYNKQLYAGRITVTGLNFCPDFVIIDNFNAANFYTNDPRGVSGGGTNCCYQYAGTYTYLNASVGYSSDLKTAYVYEGGFNLPGKHGSTSAKSVLWRAVKFVRE